MNDWHIESTPTRDTVTEGNVDESDREAVLASVNVIEQALRPQLLASLPLGYPTMVMVVLRWDEGRNAMLAMPSDDPADVIETLWTALVKTLEAHEVPIDGFLEIALGRDDADEG